MIPRQAKTGLATAWTAACAFVLRHRLWFGAAIGALLPLVVLLVWLGASLPVSRALEPLPSRALILLDDQGQPFARRGAYKEAPVVIAALPRHVPAAFVAIEDRRFYRHIGIDFQGAARALLVNAKAHRTVQGGSTITQQLAKNAFLTPERSLRRKGQEAMIALWLELRLSKDEILSRYLSSIYFGDGVYGLGAAARHYFGKPPEQLSIGEAAMLAGIVKAPVDLDPVDHPQAAGARARLVLDAMVQTKAISREQAQAAGHVVAPATRADLPVGGYFADWISPQVKSAFDGPGYGEVRVPTTLDSRLQRIVERAAAKEMKSAAKAKVGQVAVVAMRPDGRVVAMLGGANYRQSPFNRAVQARRQPGSAFKLFVYLAALRDGATPDNLVIGDPVTIGGWTPSNYEGGGGRDLTIRDAFAQSNNIIAARVYQQAGGSEVVRAARDLGIVSPLREDDATLALGTAETSLLELTAAYAAVAAGKMPVRPYGRPRTTPIAAADMDTAERAALYDLLGAVVEEGTGRAARLGQKAYGKTGTTQDYRDALFVGFTGDLVVGVWVGNDDHSPMKRMVGGDLPARIWREVMTGGLKAGLVARDGPPEPRYDRVKRLEPEVVEPAPRPRRVPKWIRRIFGL
ncbi:penicillin-binding protein 1A [Caulobacter rhizosphaerae]|uniref:peptidoglycan glycosyltransferase n=1 Tax=Caulobacter rhizosphaerae TaxID=2010972 RepID=A0ABU1N4V1_9CAUL|nr:transglycosylase domain-containing protein [Caulobacter rhizosphaerae]MDR6533478.1 penicillin-binding protein 1A [Caulobacter rhizosphaerae]